MSICKEYELVCIFDVLHLDYSALRGPLKWSVTRSNTWAQIRFTTDYMSYVQTTTLYMSISHNTILLQNNVRGPQAQASYW